MTIETRIFPSPAAVADEAADLFVVDARAALAARDVFFVALAGGTTPRETYLRLAASPRSEAIDWRRVHVFFGDERCLPPGHPDRNDKAARLALLDRVPIPEKNVHAIEADSPDAAELYESELRSAFHLGMPAHERGVEAHRGAMSAPTARLPVFDLVLLGMGSDGHTASLFPERAALLETRHLAVRVEDAPKPPPERITLTLPVLNAARHALFLVTGAEKRAAAVRLRAGDPAIPAGRVAATKTTILLDAAAASGITPA